MSGDVDKSEFINHFITFEREVRNIPFVQQVGGRFLSIPEIIRLLVSHEIVNRDDAGQMYEINKIRNLIVHGEPIEKVDREIDEALQKVTAKISEVIQNRNL